MADTPSASAYLPSRISLTALRTAAATCRGCDLYKNATQTVFGAGAAHARLLFVGEQPGDHEDVSGHPFVGPTGALLQRALTDAGIERKQIYLTNAVKHFKWERRGQRRLHRSPAEREIRACRPWLLAEVAAIKPAVLVCLGAVAARAVFERAVRLRDLRGQLHPSPLAAFTLATLHPSALLRLRAASERAKAYGEFVGELQMASQAVPRQA